MEMLPKPNVENEADPVEPPISEEMPTGPEVELINDGLIGPEIRLGFTKVIDELKGKGFVGAKKPDRAAEPLWLAAEIKALENLSTAFAALDRLPTDEQARELIEELTPDFGDEEHNYKWRRAVKYAALYALQEAQAEFYR